MCNIKYNSGFYVHSDVHIQLSLQGRLMTQSLLHVQLILADMEHLVFSLIRDSNCSFNIFDKQRS